MRLKLYVSILFFAIAIQAKSQIVINEIMYNPPESGSDTTEFIEILNAGAESVDITGYHFLEGVEDTVGAVVLGPGEYYVFSESASAMMNVFGVVSDQWTDGALSNGGEMIVFADANGTMVDMVTYDDGGDWDTDPDGNGPSLELISPELDNDNGSNWQASFTGTGVIVESNEIKATPGALNSINTGGPAITIEAKNLKFTPDFALVELGETVRWTNDEAIPHNVNGMTSSYPNNPVSFFSGTAAPGPWTFDLAFDTDGYYDYHCDPHLAVDMVGVVAVFDPDGYTPFTYPQVRDNLDENVITQFDGVPTQLTGIVHGNNYSTNGFSFYMMDANNRGINVFSFDPVSGYEVNEGDEIRIWGQIDQFRGLLEIIPDSIELLSSGNALLAPMEVNEVTEATEGSFLQISGLTLDSVQTTGSSGSNLFYSKDGGGTVVVRVDADTDIDVDNIPSGALTITGIGNQFDTDAPYNSGYQLLPRSSADFEGVSSIPAIPNDAITLFPNPTSNAIVLRTDELIEAIQIYSINGQQLVSRIINESGARLNVERFNPGLYVIEAHTLNGVWTSRFVKQ